MSHPPLGAHVSIAGGVHKAIGRGQELACDTLQVFVKSPSQWRAAVLAEESCAAFRQAQAASEIGPVVAHSSYLINLAATNPTNLTKSRDALADELDRCSRLGISGLVLHPGAHLGAGPEAGLDLVAASLDAVLDGLDAGSVKVLLETTAGQGTVLGSDLAELAAIIDRSNNPAGLGICVDTCHVFAAGYPVHEEAGYEAFFEELDRLLGLESVGCLHLNDSQRPFGSRRDRHANIGEGEIGLPLFARLLHDPRLRSTPMIVETPLGDDERGHERDLTRLRSL